LAIVRVIDPVVPVLSLWCWRVWLAEAFVGSVRTGRRSREHAGYEYKSEHGVSQCRLAFWHVSPSLNFTATEMFKTESMWIEDGDSGCNTLQIRQTLNT
jgi:hypothetical protein